MGDVHFFFTLRMYATNWQSFIQPSPADDSTAFTPVDHSTSWNDLSAAAGARANQKSSPPRKEISGKRTTLEGQLAQQNLYKTWVCRSYEETGACRYGGKCQFAHGKHELRPVLRHPKYKTEIRKTFFSSGTCPYGKRCRFIHSTLPLAVDVSQTTVPVMNTTPPPSWFSDMSFTSSWRQDPLPLTPIEDKTSFQQRESPSLLGTRSSAWMNSSDFQLVVPSSQLNPDRLPFFQTMTEFSADDREY